MTEQQSPRDRLLFATRLVLTLLIAGTLLLIALAMVGIPAMFLFKAQLEPQLVQSGFPANSIPWLALMAALAAVMAVLGFLFFRHLRRIVDSVSSGDPFVPINADRLRAMAWLSLGVQGVVFLLTPLIIWFDAMPHKPNVHHSDSGLSFGSMILALLLFVLARVFRVGSQMREELEGTV